MPHDHGDRPQPSAFEELIRLQGTFQQNLTQATMNYLRQIQGIVGPVTPGTIVERRDGAGLALALPPGGAARASFTVENRQRVHAMITPMLTPLVSGEGATWFAEAELSPATALLATDEVGTFALSLAAPEAMPLGVYRGAVLIYGCANGVMPLEVTIAMAVKSGASSEAPAGATTGAARPAPGTRAAAGAARSRAENAAPAAAASAPASAMAPNAAPAGAVAPAGVASAAASRGARTGVAASPDTPEAPASRGEPKAGVRSAAAQSGAAQSAAAPKAPRPPRGRAGKAAS